jgi:hypothetical protein
MLQFKNFLLEMKNAPMVSPEDQTQKRKESLSLKWVNGKFSNCKANK